jgi:hypothetical protein
MLPSFTSSVLVAVMTGAPGRGVLVGPGIVGVFVGRFGVNVSVGGGGVGVAVGGGVPGVGGVGVVGDGVKLVKLGTRTNGCGAVVR